MNATETHPLLIDGSGAPGLTIHSHTIALRPPHEFVITVQCSNGMSGLIDLICSRGCDELMLLSDNGKQYRLRDVKFLQGETPNQNTLSIKGVAASAECAEPQTEAKAYSLPFDLLGMLGKGIKMKCGRHCEDRGMSGYWAKFYEGDSANLGGWPYVGHGATVEEALIEAKALFDGSIRRSQHKSEDFLPLDHIHGWFGLSYAQYLTVPRSVLQSMPEEWQSRFVACLNELDDAIDWRPKEGRYRVQLMTTRENWEEGGFVETVWDKELEDPLMDYERGRRRIERKAA